MRAAGGAAILAGVLHAASALPPGTLPLDERQLQTMYLVVDALLVLGIAGVLGRLGGSLLGVAGFVGVVAGTMIIRTGGRSTFGAASYSSGSTLLAAGLAVLALPLLRLGGTWRLAGLCWLASLGLGVLSLLPNIVPADWRGASYMAASLLFSAGMIAAGAALFGGGAGRRR